MTTRKGVPWSRILIPWFRKNAVNHSNDRRRRVALHKRKADCVMLLIRVNDSTVEDQEKRSPHIRSPAH